LLLCEGKDAGAPLVRLGAGKWSDWVRAGFETEEMGAVEAAFRFRLVECAPDGGRLRLYRSEAFPTDGRFVSDAELGRELVAELGPYVHAMTTVGLHLVYGLLDWETVDRALADEAKWWAAAAKIAMERHEADLLYLHYHLPDTLGHLLVPRVDPSGTEYSPEAAEEAWPLLRRYYGAIDRFVGEFLACFDLDQCAVAVVAEHGMPANKKAVALVNAFNGKGWLKLTPDGQDVDWAVSKLFVAQNHLWINLEGREPTGVVLPDQYEDLRAEVQKVMRDIKDPDTGEHVFSFVLTREEAPMVGLWGEQIGDLVFCYAGGCRWTGPEVLRLGEERVVFPCRGGNHGPMICTYETEVGSVYGLLILAGRGVRKGVREAPPQKGSRKTVDVAPTLTHLLGIGPPAQCEGRALHEFLEGFDHRRPQRRLTPTARDLVFRHRRKAKIQLRGDVTDEGTP
ncbi:MAG: alkaline phosphatase family protein, partial [Planctomycetota bacterium]